MGLKATFIELEPDPKIEKGYNPQIGNDPNLELGFFLQFPSMKFESQSSSSK